MNLRHYFALLFLIFSCISNYTSSEFRIVGGIPWFIERSPHLVSIHHMDRNRCVGALVTLDKVVTAASCLLNLVHLKEFELIVAAGVTDFYDIPLAGQTSSVAHIYVPYDYDPETYHMDIALMILHKTFSKTDTVQTIPFCRSELKEGMDMRISGWGWKTPGNGETSNILQSTVLTTMSRTSCECRYRATGKIFSTSMICAAKDRSDACYEDFGGPGVVNGELCAVLSHNLGCSGADYPSVFTTLNNICVQKFLNEAMANRLQCIVINPFLSGESPKLKTLFS